MLLLKEQVIEAKELGLKIRTIAVLRMLQQLEIYVDNMGL